MKGSVVEAAGGRRFGQAWRLRLELVRFSHTLFAMPFALLAGWWASWQPWPDGAKLPSAPALLAAIPGGWLTARWLGIAVCLVAARTFAMAVNRLADAGFDAANPRTAGRHLPAGLLSPTEVLRLVWQSAVAVLLASWLFWPNWLPLAVAPLLLVFLAGYSYAKRFTWLVHFWLGASLMLAPICAWLALRGEAVWWSAADLFPAFWLGLAVLFWVAGFDIIYACQDTEFDRSVGLKSIPARFGNERALKLAAGLHAVMLIVLAALPWLAPELRLGWLFGGAVGLVAVLLVIEHRVVSPDDLGRVNLAFFHLNSWVGLILLVAGSLDAWWG